MKQCWHRWLWFNILCVLVLATVLPPTSAQKPKVSRTSTTAAPAEEETSQDEQLEASEGEANATDPRLTGNPQIDYIYDPNLPRELNGYNLSDYPFLDRLPKAEEIQFTCDNLHDGFYADIALKCQVYHHCLSGLRQDFLCPVYTAFDQKTFICHFVNKVDCVNSENHWNRNDNLYRPTTTTTTTTTSAPTRAPPRDYRDYYDYDDRPRRRRPYGRGKMRPAAFDDYDYDRYERRRPGSRRPLNRPRRPYDDEEEEEDRRPYRRPRPRDDDDDRLISRDERPRRPLEGRPKRVDDDDDDDIRPKRPMADSLRPKRPIVGAERTKRPIDEEVIGKIPIEDADVTTEELKPKRPDFSRPKGLRPRKERPVSIDEPDTDRDAIKPRDEISPVDSRSNAKEEEARPNSRPRNRRPYRDDGQNRSEDRNLKGKQIDEIPEDLMRDAPETDELLYRPMGNRKRPFTNRNIDDEDRIEKQEPTVLVKPNGPGLFSQPRIPPKIKRPVPINAKEKYEYMTITTTKSPKVYDDYDYEDLKRPTKKDRKPQYEDDYEQPQAKTPRAKPRNKPKNDDYYYDY